MKKATTRQHQHDQLGFSLLELIITISLVSILAAFAIPNLQSYIMNSRINGASQQLIQTFQTARSEATKRQRNVVVCLADSTPTCTMGNKPSGWIVFEDANANWLFDSTETLISVRNFNATKLSVLADGSNRVSYNATGFAAIGNGANPQIRSTGMVICDRRGNVDSNGGAGEQSVARGLIIAGTGRVSLTKLRSNTTPPGIEQLLTATGSSCS